MYFGCLIDSSDIIFFVLCIFLNSRARSRLTGSFTGSSLLVLTNGFNFGRQNTSSTGIFVITVIAGSVIIVVLPGFACHKPEKNKKISICCCYSSYCSLLCCQFIYCQYHLTPLQLLLWLLGLWKLLFFQGILLIPVQQL
jgi:hypothetical protein